ncbi:MAG TPA: PKD domain-containing protein [Vicinamibacteria bacterium]|nr:PKD domain-containing protein [Vicinamibacteria bacterium]
MSLLLPGCDQESPARTSPTVSLSRTPEGTAIAGATQVVFTATASDASGGTLTVSWDLGDGEKASGASVVHVYASAGVFPVAVTASNGSGGVTTVGSSITVGSLSGRWRLSEGGERFYESGFDVAQAASVLGGQPFSVPDQGCLGDLHGRVVSPRTVRFEFTGCDGNVVRIDGTAGDDLRAIPGTYTHPDGPPQAMVLTRE